MIDKITAVNTAVRVGFPCRIEILCNDEHEHGRREPESSENRNHVGSFMPDDCELRTCKPDS